MFKLLMISISYIIYHKVTELVIDFYQIGCNMDDTSTVMSDSVSSMSDVPMSIVKLILTPILSFSSLFSTEVLQGYNLMKVSYY